MSIQKHLLIAFLLMLAIGTYSSEQGIAQEQLDKQVDNVLLISVDGLRWQEVFEGADRRLINKDAGVANPTDILRRYDSESAHDRRKLLMPFLWSTIASDGQILGNPEQGSNVHVTNGMHFSYPGYNEILAGFGDPAIESNDKTPNANQTVLEWLNRQPGFEGRIAAFASWDVFPFIINAERSGVYVNAGWQPLDVVRHVREGEELNRLANQLPHYWEGVRYDAFTFRGALEYLHVKRPRVLYVAFGETDDWAHAGRYDLYLDAAEKTDDWIRQLWEACQSLDQYRGRTAMIITTDHGRGDGRDSWKSHSTDIPGCDRIWIAALGPGVTSFGERKDVSATQAQVAATVAALLGLDFFVTDDRIAKPLPF